MVEKIEYTAQDEMPSCGVCDHICDDFNCCDWCGAEHGWWGYRRTVTVNIGYFEKLLKGRAEDGTR